MELTQDLYEALMPYEVHLRRGYKGRYTFGLTKPIFEKLYKIYLDLGFTRQQNYNCNSCLLDLTSVLGRLYFDYQEKLTEIPLESSQTESVEQLQADGNKVAKRGGKVVRKANKTTSKRKAVK